MDKQDLLTMSIGDLAAHIPAAWELLQNHGDLCYCGHQNLREWCAATHQDCDKLVDSLYALSLEANNPWVQERSLTALCEHISKEFHEPQREQMARINALFASAVQSHGVEFEDIAALADLAERFYKFSQATLEHFGHEEQDLFPELLSLDIWHPTQPAPARSIQFGVLSNEIRHWEAEHRDVSVEIDQMLCELTRIIAGAKPPLLDALCTEIQKFFVGLRQHLHFENHILLPACMQVEQALAV
jgi:iron-sulfur cluster repair protein YtfE (RIC family)